MVPPPSHGARPARARDGPPCTEAGHAHRELLLRLVVLVQVDPRPAVLLHGVAGEQLPGRKRGVFTHITQAAPCPTAALTGAGTAASKPRKHGSRGRKREGEAHL